MSTLKLTDFDISMTTGFLMEDPLTELPPYFDPWNKLAKRMVELVEMKTMQDEVNKMPLLDIDRLAGDKEEKLAHLQLVFIISGYLWQNQPHLAPTVLPKSLAVPLYGLYKKRGYRPVLTYADVMYNNCVKKNPDEPIALENIESIYRVPAEKTEWDWFISISYMTEYEWAKACQPIQEVLDGLEEDDERKIAAALGGIRDALGGMKDAATLYHGRLTTENFFPKMTTYFLGYGDAALQDGLTFEGVDGVGPLKERTANAGQSASMKVLDALLNIVHPEEREKVLVDIARYLQPRHRDFINAIKAQPKQLKPFVEASSNTELKQAYIDATDAVRNFRTYHVQLVTKYFVQAIKKNFSEEEQEKMKPVTKHTMDLLKGTRDDSKQTLST